MSCISLPADVVLTTIPILRSVCSGGVLSLNPNQPYGELASLYDRVMLHVKYDNWAEYISLIFDRYRKKVGTILEIACGTGSLSIYLHKLGYDIICTDLSPTMLAVASEKFKKNGMPQKLFAADMTLLPMVVRCDAVLCLYDSINYLKAPADFMSAVSEASRVLKRGGLYIFDVCTVKNSRMFFSNHTVVEDLGEVKYERVCTYKTRQNIQENLFIIEHDGRRIKEKHEQRIYRLGEIDVMIKGLPFKTLGIFDDLTFRDGTENSERVHYVLERI